ncbi:MAG: hypothetical protein ACR2LK_16260 [Solirubrobacteraceae bacterium]
MIRAACLALLLGIALAAPAQAGVIAAGDAAELAQSLAEAQQEQGICYGWQVTNNFDSTPDVGSSTGGPGVALGQSPGDEMACARGLVELTGSIKYSCASCEASDSASVSVQSSLGDAPTTGDLEDLGLKAGALTGDKDDTTLINMVDALPLLLADRGLAPYVEYEPATAVPASDRATDSPGSDLLRERWLLLILFGSPLIAAPCFYLYRRAQNAAHAAARRRRQPSSPAASSNPPEN